MLFTRKNETVESGLLRQNVSNNGTLQNVTALSESTEVNMCFQEIIRDTKCLLWMCLKNRPREIKQNIQDKQKKMLHPVSEQVDLNTPCKSVSCQWRSEHETVLASSLILKIQEGNLKHPWKWSRRSLKSQGR